MVHSYEIEKQVLASLIQQPKNVVEYLDILHPDDFYSSSSKINRTLFLILSESAKSNQPVDEILITERLKELGIKFQDDIDVYDYVRALSMRKLNSEDKLKSLIQALKKMSVRRKIAEVGQNLSSEMKSMSSDSGYMEIISKADSIYNSTIDLFHSDDQAPANIFNEMEEWIEVRGENPVTEFGMMGPHPTINKIYGSLLRPGNISVIVARSGIGKTQFCMHYATEVARQYSVPVLHFDNGEMSKEELIIRQCAQLSGVKSHLLETGLWRQAGSETVKKVRSVWKDIKKLQFFYYNVGGMEVDPMINALKRFYYSNVGRGKRMVFSFDYIKTTNDLGYGTTEWQSIGKLVDKYKKAIQKDILDDGNPTIPMITSVQANKSGITTNRHSDHIIDDESIVSLSDRITQFCTHMFILRHKTNDEIAMENNMFGTHKLIAVKNRHLGEDIVGATQPVQDGDRLRKNYINLDFNNFKITDKGDLRDFIEWRDRSPMLQEDDGREVPSLEDL
jgi:replicative DNA helicase